MIDNLGNQKFSFSPVENNFVSSIFMNFIEQIMARDEQLRNARSKDGASVMINSGAKRGLASLTSLEHLPGEQKM